MTCEIWWAVNILSNSSSLALAVWDRQYLEDSERKDDQLILVIEHLQVFEFWGVPLYFIHYNGNYFHYFFHHCC